jgi:hypothetical protein
MAVGMQEGEPISESEHPCSETIAVYPSEKESLWSIARKYRVSPEQIAESNRLPSEALESADLPSSIDGSVRLLIEK